MTKKRKIKSTISADIVRFLREEKNMTLKQIGDLMKLSESFISRIASGQRGFRIEHLVLLEESLNFPFPLLILISRDKKSIPSKLRRAYESGRIAYESGRIGVLAVSQAAIIATRRRK